MPMVRHHHPNPPTLHMGKNEQKRLQVALRTLKDIESAAVGYNAELATQAAECADRLGKLSEVTELDLSKPW